MNAPHELQQVPHWVGWKYGPVREDGKRPKWPIDPLTGRMLKGDTATWGDTYAVAQAAVERFKLEGVGFMFADGGGYAGVDFDDCIINGELTPEAAEAVRALNSYTEISPSGTGVKVFLMGTKPAGSGCAVLNVLGSKRVEVYDHGRYFTVTGKHLAWTPATVEPRQAELTALCRQLRPKTTTAKQELTTTAKQTTTTTTADGMQILHTPQRVSQSGGTIASDVMRRCWACILTMKKSKSGERGHDACLAAACTCWRLALADDEAWAIMQRFNRERCDEGDQWSDDELRRKLDQAREIVERDGQWGEMLRKTRPVKERPWHNTLPRWIREIPTLRPYPEKILQVIANKCDKRPLDATGSLGTARVGYRALAKECGMSERCCKDHVRTMLSMGMLVRVTKGGIRFDTGEVLANEYQIPGEFGALDGVQELHTQHTPTTGLPDGDMQNMHPVAAKDGT